MRTAVLRTAVAACGPGSLDEQLDAIEAAAEPMARERWDLGHEEISDPMQFLEALTDPHVIHMADLTTASVPSGLPVDR